MSVDDHGLEAIRKSAIEIVPGDKAEYRIRTSSDVTGEITPSGLKIELKTSTVTVGTTATAIPATALSDRNALAIHNKSSTQTLYIGPSSVTADDAASTGGWEVEPGGRIQFDVTEAVVVYGVYPTSSEAVKIMEIA